MGRSLVTGAQWHKTASNHAMDDQHQHPLLVQRDHDDESRQQFARSLRAHLFNEVQPGVYHLVGAKAATEGPITDRHQVREMIANHPYYRSIWPSNSNPIRPYIRDRAQYEYRHLRCCLAGASAPPSEKPRVSGNAC